jgi:amidophosphoribosyltransferase
MCGVIGITGNPDAAKEAYLGLLTLQHRGQDAAGILTYGKENLQFSLYKDEGLVSSVFSQVDFEKQLSGQMAIAHTRYQTVGNDHVNNIQPMLVNYPYGIGMVHNGNIVNYDSLCRELREKQRRFSLTQNDLEVIQHLFSEGLLKHSKQGRPTFENIVASANDLFEKAKGGYSVLSLIAGVGMVAFRDPHGLRPLILGKKGNSYAIASESNALKFLDYEVLRDVKPGEVILIDEEAKFHSSLIQQTNPKPCMFEWIYFANPESDIENRPVYLARKELGKRLGLKVRKMMERGEIRPDIVVPVPETSRIAAISLAETLGLPYREALIKNRYVQRSFILKDQLERKSAVELKLAPIESELKGKSVLLLDDSIVRGTTSKHLIQLVKKAGAKEIYFASACPPIKNPCYFGVDFPNADELVANGRNENEIADSLGASRVIYLDLEDLLGALKVKDSCMACLDGKYPVDISEAEAFRVRRNKERSINNNEREV